MAKKSLGYVELEWACPSCGTKNPGPQKTCLSCGMPQPEDVKFEQRAEEKLISDEAKIAQAKAGPDIHCYYCGSRNPATATNCSQCGADLTEGARRDKGQVVGAHRDKPAPQIECPACGAPNNADAPKCVNCGASLAEPKPEPAQPTPAQAPKPRQNRGMLGIGLAVVALLCAAACVAYFVLAGRTEDLTGTVQGVSWSRSVQIEGLVPVEYEDWRDEIPPEGLLGQCTDRVRHTQNEPAPNSREVCGTPYTVDTGSGFGEVVQDCRYEVFDEFCTYTLDEWREVDEIAANGDGFSPQWPQLNLRAGQRQGKRNEVYRCIFSTESGAYTFTTSNQNLFEQCQIGSRWQIKVNTFNVVTDIEPLR